MYEYVICFQILKLLKRVHVTYDSVLAPVSAAAQQLKHSGDKEP